MSISWTNVTEHSKTKKIGEATDYQTRLTYGTNIGIIRPRN